MIAILKYNAGNVQSVIHALQRLGVEPLLTDDADLLLKADKVIFPGVGEASSTMQYLREKQLDVVIKQIQKPLLGICLGMQLLCNHSEENNTTCLGMFDAMVKKFPPKEKVPHIGWNNIYNTKTDLLASLENEDVYFVHSYYVEQNNYEIATCNYILPFAAALHKNNLYAAQFHPEKSGDIGSKLLQNFLDIKN